MRSIPRPQHEFSLPPVAAAMASLLPPASQGLLVSTVVPRLDNRHPWTSQIRQQQSAFTDAGVSQPVRGFMVPNLDLALADFVHLLAVQERFVTIKCRTALAK